MYRDIKNISFIEVKSDTDVSSYIQKNQIEMKDVIFIGFKWVDTSLSFEDNFYLQNNVKPIEKWNSFYVKRDKDREKSLHEKYDISGEYIFVHDDDRFKINQDYLPKDIKIIKPKIGLTDNIFDYLMIIENAISVHCIESSFAFLIDNLSINSNFTIHRYARLISKFETPTYKNVSKIIE
jgi:hypothetical protein